MKIRVILFDDHRERRDGLELLINSIGTMECIATYNDCRHVLKNVQDTNPDVVLMDIDMPFVHGIDGVRTIRSKYPDLKILMQTVFEDEKKVFAAICAGANGYILKQTNPLKLIDSISEVLEGGAPMTPTIAAKVLELFHKSQKITIRKDFELTKRELEILAFLVKGYSYKMIAKECFISYPTVNTHISRIYKKLQVQSASGAVSKALKEGLVD
jgi:DNA-binding NarL/FixJ family response regulator